jgi:hypothetical protein
MVITEEQLQELQRKVSTALEVLGRSGTKMRPPEMGPLEGELRAVEDKERLERPHEICVIPQDSKFTLGGLARKLVELRHNKLTVFIVEPQNGQAAGHDELKAIEAVAQKSHPEAAVVVASDFDGLQLEDNRRYQELLDYRAEQQRIAEEKERARLAREAEEERRRQEQERQRKQRQAQLLEVVKKASKVLAVLAVVAGLGYGGYMIKDDVAEMAKNAMSDLGGSKKTGQKEMEPRQPIKLPQQSDTTITEEITWSASGGIVKQSFTIDPRFDQAKAELKKLEPLPTGISLFTHEGDSTLLGFTIEIHPDSINDGPQESIEFSSSEMPGLTVSSLVIILKKSEDESVEQAPENGDSGAEQESALPAVDSTTADTSMTPESTP